MKLFRKASDGGPDSGVTGYWLIEWKRGFSIVFLHFAPGSRDAYHSHAFNATTWFLKGTVIEEDIDGSKLMWRPSLLPKRTPRSKFHKVLAGPKGAWALSFRGPWSDTWEEYKHGRLVYLTSGRVEFKENESV